jgi:hypothetical protein
VQEIHTATRRQLVMLCTHLDHVDEDLVEKRGLLASWPQTQLSALLDVALEEQALKALKLASGSGAATLLDDAGLLAKLHGVVTWCAPRSLRSQLQTFLIGRGSRPVGNGGPSHWTLLHEGNATAQRILVQRLTGLRPLKRRSAERLHQLLRAHARVTEDKTLLHEQVSTQFFDSVALKLCMPFMTSLVESGGPRPGLDVSHLAASFAAMGGVEVLALFAAAGYTIERGGDGVVSGVSARCLRCPWCCLKDGVLPTPQRAWFSPTLAASAAWQPTVLTWLKQYGAGTPSTTMPTPSLPPPLPPPPLPSPPPPAASEGAVNGGGGWRDGGGSWRDGTGEEGPPQASCDIATVAADWVLREPARFFERYIVGSEPVVVRGLLAADQSLAPLAEVYSRSALLQRLGRTEWEIGDIPCASGTAFSASHHA